MPENPNWHIEPDGNVAANRLFSIMTPLKTSDLINNEELTDGKEACPNLCLLYLKQVGLNWEVVYLWLYPPLFKAISFHEESSVLQHEMCCWNVCVRCHSCGFRACTWLLRKRLRHAVISQLKPWTCCANCYCWIPMCVFIHPQSPVAVGK